ncbi:MAG: Hvo_1808 family surface protein [Haloferacaceae archaeon]
MRAAHIALAVLVVVGTVAPAAGAATGVDRQAQTRADLSSADRQAQTRADPSSDRVGWENGYWHDDAVSVDQSDGLSDAELEAYVARAMARVEYLREAEFEKSVPVEVISRDEFRQRANNGTSSDAFAAWNNQVWEALFIDGEDSNVQDELGRTVGESVTGFYSPGNDEIRIVTDTPESPTIDNATLVHELTHALQDQTVDLTSEQLSGGTQDADLAVDGLVEGEANLIESLYTRRCGTEWECVEAPSSGGGSGGERPNLGILLTILQPYSDGPVYVNDLRRQRGWDAVTAAYERPPASTEQVIHLTDEEPRPVAFEDRARGDWKPYPDQGENGSDTVGEASIYSMFWYQARTANADTVDPRAITRTSTEFDTYDYGAEPSAGWANDRVFPYRDGPAGENDTRHGYVWVTEWDTERDAREFHRAYLAILSAHDARTREDGIRVVEEGRFADAFRVVRNGTRVTVVNGPTPTAVDAIRPGLTDVGTGGSADGSGSGDGGEDDGDDPRIGSGRSAPGFGPVVALLAILATAAVALRRRH